MKSSIQPRHEGEGKGKCDMGIWRCSSSIDLLVFKVELVENEKHAKARVPLDLWLGWIDPALQLKDSGTKFVLLPNNWVEYLLTECPFLPETGHNDFEH